MHKKAVFPSKYIQGQGALSELPDLISRLGKKGMILASPSVITKVLPTMALTTSNDIVIEGFRGECCEEELDRIEDKMNGADIDVLVGMGGGKTIDTVKIAADRARIPVIVVPTIASTDAPTSGCAVVYSKDGVFQKVHYQRSNPTVVLVDLDIIAAAPARFLVSGMGDALSTWFEARSCSQTLSSNECGGISTLAGLHIAKLCYETLLAYGKEARYANELHIVTAPFDHIVEANTLLSGLGFESSGLATAHSIHNGLTALDETHAYYHGEKVAFGVLTGLHLTGAPLDEMETVYTFCEDVGLPTTLADIGLEKVDDERLMIAAKKACAPDQPIHHEEGVITPERVLYAMLQADGMGRARKESKNLR